MTKEEILNDEMSDKFMELIDSNDPLRQWIYCAMEIYSQQELKLLRDYFTEQIKKCK